jgi:endonuclease-3 related protein
MMVGAILIQHTAWRNAEKALDNLRRAGLLEPQRLLRISGPRLAALIRPAGMPRVKTKRLGNFLRWYQKQGGFEDLQRRATPDLRSELLAVNGIGRETADDVLVYAFRRPVFVVDAYARRIFRRFGLISGAEGYEQIRKRVEGAMPDDPHRLGEFHALLVAHAKASCRSRPLCDGCCLRRRCARNLEG